MSAPALIARSEIHKSCKALEVVVNALNDYCEAVTAIVTIQKRLVKALRNSASTKCTAEVAANTLNSAADIFEACSEVGSKFAKIADKECDGISTDVKKWFKELSKEEKLHDERIMNVEAKIKQAGLQYEKKVKKNPIEAHDEHTRYINLLTALGPEITQEKHKHSRFVSNRQEAIMFTLGACLGRVADAEWLRTFENVRKVAPTVGQLGEWRALCEGGWTGNAPHDLPDPTASTTKGSFSNNNEETLSTPYLQDVSQATSLGDHNLRPPPVGGRPTMPEDLPPAGGDFRDRSHSMNSITSLTSFPTPPTHFPLPPLTPIRTYSDTPDTPNKEDVPTPRALALQSVEASSKFDNQRPPKSREEALAKGAPPLTRTESPTTFLDLHVHDDHFDHFSTSPTTPSPAEAKKELTQAPGTPTSPSSAPSNTSPKERRSSQSSEDKHEAPASAPSSISTPARRSFMFKKGDYMDDTEFGVRKGETHIPTHQPQALPAQMSVTVERSDTNRSNVSVVAVMRERYARSTAPASPPPKDVPKLPLSVSNLANRFESTVSSVGSSSSRIAGMRSPTEDRQYVFPEPRTRALDSPLLEKGGGSSSQSSSGYLQHRSTPTPTPEEISQRRWRIRELEELELREQEVELRLKEREVEQRTRELEINRLRVTNARNGRSDGYISDTPRTTSDRPHLANSPSSSPLLSPRHPFASSTTQLSSQVPQRYSSQQSSTSASQPPSPLNGPTQHPSNCLCDGCSTSRSRESFAFSRDSRSPETPVTFRSEKPKGWMRRLSMPSINPFNSDSKKGVSSAGISPSTYRNSMALPDDGRGPRQELTGGSKNRSSTNLVRR